MILEPIINVRLNKFIENYELDNISKDQAFERFANYMILSSHQPDAFTTENELMELISVGGPNDMGIDGIAIKLNGTFIRSIEDIVDVLAIRKSMKASFEFIFIQSKHKSKFDLGEYTKFVDGVEEFLGEQVYQPINDAVKQWREIKEYIYSDEIMINWAHSPNVRLYYVVMGNWENSTHIMAKSEKSKQNLEKTNNFQEVSFHYVDSRAFKEIISNNENEFSVIINFIDSMSLTEVKDVENSCIILCTGEELIKLLGTDDNLIRKNLFNDNVRDYQGDTTINNDISNTIATEPESFMLLNNGVTIVCDEANMGNRKITIKNPQIVNGCQTSNVLFNAYKKNYNLANLAVSVKIIATHSDEITNKIVKGTNRQNIVYDEAFEITRDFHKELEEFFSALSSEDQAIDKIFYERRSKQYADNITIKPYQKISFRILIQSFVATFCYAPYSGHRHEAKLLQDYQRKIFLEQQSRYPYYVSSLLYVEIEKLFREEIIDKKLYYPYKLHIMLLVKEIAGGTSPDINQTKEIDTYCKKLLDKISKKEKLIEYVKKAMECFDRTLDEMVSVRGTSYKYGIKESIEFTQHILVNSGSDLKIGTIDKNTGSKKYRGKVMNISQNTSGLYYGFIQKNPNNIYFHQIDNAELNFSTLKDREVEYEIKKVDGKERGINIKEV